MARGSGEYVSTGCSISKRGSPYLRKALCGACRTVRPCEPRMRAVYERKAAAGKRRRVALGRVAKELMAMILSMLKAGELCRCPEGQKESAGN